MQSWTLLLTSWLEMWQNPASEWAGITPRQASMATCWPIAPLRAQVRKSSLDLTVLMCWLALSQGSSTLSLSGLWRGAKPAGRSLRKPRQVSDWQHSVQKWCPWSCVWFTVNWSCQKALLRAKIATVIWYETSFFLAVILSFLVCFVVITFSTNIFF